MTPQITDSIANPVSQVRQPDLTYRLGTDTVVGKIDKLESIKQAIYHILSVERYSNPIYDDDYGVELEQYIGADIGTVKADIENTLREALTQDDRINDVVVDSITQSGNASCLVEFTIYTIYGNVEEEINVLQ